MRLFFFSEGAVSFSDGCANKRGRVAIPVRNLTMLTDLYQLTMMYGYFKKGMRENQAVFDLFYRPIDISAYAIVAGLEQVIEYIENLHFTEADLSYLRSLHLFDEAFLAYLSDMRFEGELYAMTEGSVAFPYEPLIRVKAPIMQAQFMETALLNIVNHQTLIATKASRVVYAAQGSAVLEFGLRRAQGPDAGIYGARAAVIGGCVSTSNVMTGKLFGVPVGGTHAHSWVMSFPDELASFRAYADVFPQNCVLLVDTYDTLKSGVPNAITVFRELREKGVEPVGIRLDSGDLAYLSKEARRMLDEAGFPQTKIVVSGDLDEELIHDLRAQGSRIDVWGVGTRLITGNDQPALGGVYKLAAEIAGGVMTPKIKVSENPAKITLPGYKIVKRIYANATGKAIADLIMLDGETIDTGAPLRIFDPNQTWKSMVIENFSVRDMLVPVFIEGKCVYEKPTLGEICVYAKREMDSLWEESKRLRNPHVYKVDYSQALFDLRNELLQRYSNQ